VKEFLATAPGDPGICSIIAIGSAIRQYGHGRSDLDLLVLHDAARLKLKAPIAVDIRAYPIGNAEELIARGHEILCWSIRFGLALYDAKRSWEGLRQKWITKVPIPSETEALQRAERDMYAAKKMLEIGDETASGDLLLVAIAQASRATLIRHGVFPASRPELPEQLRAVRTPELACLLEDALRNDVAAQELLNRLETLRFMWWRRQEETSMAWAIDASGAIGPDRTGS
jgi:hypothetical protein